MAAKEPPRLPPIPSGWKGGFSRTKPEFAYPDPDLSSLPMMHNMTNMPLLTRQQGVRWPEFSWLTDPRKEDSRCFQLFSPFISRLGYDDTGRVYSIICPQQGVWIHNEVCLNVEVTVTGVRGWVNEKTPRVAKKYEGLAADMTVQGKVWLTPSQHQGGLLQMAWPYLSTHFDKLPLSKRHAIIINTHEPGNPDQPIFPLSRGENESFRSPAFARHAKERGYYAVGNLGVQIGDIEKKNNEFADEFDKLLMTAFNLASGNMLRRGNVLTWNVWFTQPELVNPHEWESHAKQWRDSIDAHHGPPYSAGEKAEWPHLLDPRPVRYFDGSHFEPPTEKLDRWLKRLASWIKRHVL